ncbi:MAG: pyridoxamine 5'-phosphate oxidase family protein [Candidatus Nitrosopolaris sp.]
MININGKNVESTNSFLTQGTFIGKLATVKKEGSSHVVPIWFVVDKRNSKGDIIFTTGSASIKAKNICRDKRVSICIDDQIPPFSFVTIFGTPNISPYKQREVLTYSTCNFDRNHGRISILYYRV